MANPSSELSSEEFILKCAFSLFLLASNYEKVTIRDFYKVYGVSSGAIYNYFRNKNELLIKMIDVYIFKVQSTENKFKLPETFTFLDFLNFYIEGVKNTIDKYAVASGTNTGYKGFFNLLYQASFRYPNFEEQVEKLFKKEELLWENLLLKAIENKEIKNDIDVKMTVAHFRSMFFGLSFQHSLTCGLNTDLLRSLFLAYYNLIKYK